MRSEAPCALLSGAPLADDGRGAHLAAAGVYLPSFERGHAEHHLTQKIRRSKVSREHDDEFAELLADTAGRLFAGFNPDLVASVPASSDRDDRFRTIRRDLAQRLDAADVGAVLRQTRAIRGYRQMTAAQRRAACEGRFTAQRAIRGARVLLIDDVVTSGSQARAAIRALLAAGAAACRFAAIAKATGPPEWGRGASDHSRAADNERNSATVSTRWRRASRMIGRW